VTDHSLAAWRFREARLLLRRLSAEVEPGMEAIPAWMRLSDKSAGCQIHYESSQLY
jgi:hypothetical protein